MFTKLYNKKLIFLVSLVLFFSFCLPAYTAQASGSHLKVKLNDRYLSFDVPPQLINQRTFVPMRGIFEELGADVQYDSASGLITASKDDTIVTLKIGHPVVTVDRNGTKSQMIMDVEPVIKNGRTLVPLRFVSQVLGKQVGYDGASNTVVIIDYDYFVKSLKEKAPVFYEFINNKYTPVYTGKISAGGRVQLNIEEPQENKSMDIEAAVDGVLNKKSGQFKGNLQLDASPSDEVLDKFKDIDFEMVFNNEDVYLKTNLLQLIAEEEGINLKGDWGKFSFVDLDIPGVKTYEDLIEMINIQVEQSPEFKDILMFPTYQTISGQVDINTFDKMNQVFNAFVPLVNGDNFTVKKLGNNEKVYNWKLEKEDFVDLVVKLYKISSEEQNSISMQDIKNAAEFNKMINQSEFDMSMKFVVENNMVVQKDIYLDVDMNIPEEGSFKIFADINSEINYPNDNKTFDIDFPSKSDVFDMTETFVP